MAFPTTPLLDNFNRTDEGPPPSANWDNDGLGGGQFKVSSNTCVTDGVAGYYYNIWNQYSGADCEGYIKITTKPVLSAWAAVFIRIQADAGDAYGILATTEAGTDTIQIIEAVDFSTTPLATYNQEISNGDIIGIRCVGTTITAFYNGVELGSVTDATYATGRVGIATIDPLAVLDDFGGGTVPFGIMTPRSGYWGDL